MKKFLRRTAIVLICLVAVWCILQALRRPWIEPISGVRLEPIRPILFEKDIKPNSAFDLMRQACAAFTVDRIQEGKALDEWDRKPWSLDGATNTLVVLEQAQVSLALARRAAEVPDPQALTVTNFDQRMPYVAKTRAIARCFNLSAKTKSVRGDYAGAFADLRSLIGFASILTRGGVLIDRLVSIACTGISCKTMRQIALNYPVQEDLLRDSIRFLEETDHGLEPWAECVRHERIIIRSYVDAFFRNPCSLPTRECPSGSLRDKAFRIVSLLFGSTPNIVKKDIDACYTHYISMAGKPYDQAAYEHFDDQMELRSSSVFGLLLTSRDPVGRSMAFFIAHWGQEDAHAEHVSMIVNLRATRVVLAIAMFKRAEGRLPQTLDELVPKYLDKVPDDPFDGKQMKYRVKADGTWVVYSVSRDKKDDGGVQDPKLGAGKLDLVFGPMEEK
jgi:hypothetical protein